MALGAYVEGQDYTVFYIAALVLIALIELCGLGYIAMEEKVGWRSFTIILQVGLRSFDMFSGMVSSIHSSASSILIHLVFLVFVLLQPVHTCLGPPNPFPGVP